MKQFDVLIIGTGIAGLTSAIKLAEDKNLSIGIITRSHKPEMTNTYWAQGGIIYPDNDEDLAQDIQKASSYTSNPHAIDIIVERGKEILDEVLIGLAKTDFERHEKGELKQTQEAAHSRKRIIYKGDYTGKEIQVSLLNLLNDQYKNVQILSGFTAIDLITPNHHGIQIQQRYEDNMVVGAYVFDQQSNLVNRVMAKKTILATGGISALYLHNSNSESSRGDGHAMAARAGAQLSNMEFIQFHPTTFYTGASHRRFLISEAVRGEGGILKNARGESFMRKYHPDAELAPRDIVSRAILSEMIENADENVFLDITHKDQSWLQDRFPTIYQYCLEHKIDMAKDPIPVVPAAHYTCGGVKVDLNGRTSLKNLYAVGEVACNGLHGANRLASTSLLEGLTFGYVAAENIQKTIKNIEFYPTEKIQEWRLGHNEIDLGLVSQDIQTLKRTMWNYLGLTRSKNRLARARAMFRELYDEIHKFYRHTQLHDELIGLRNAVEVAYMVLNASIINKKSVGCFYKEDDSE